MNKFSKLFDQAKKVATPISKSYSAILFNSNIYAGLTLILLTFININIGIGGLISVISAYIVAMLFGLNKEFLKLDYYIYNPLLVGLSLGFLFKINYISLLLFIVGGVFTFFLTYTISVLFYNYLKLPTLSLPFVISSSILYLASLKYSNLFVSSLYNYYHIELNSVDIPLWIKGYLTSLGTIFFLPNLAAGLVVSIIILMVSRIFFILSIIGYFTGALTTALFTGSTVSAFSDPSAFNFILVAMAIGGVFLIPSPKSYIFAVLSVIIAAPIVDAAKIFWENYGIPVFALPFNLVTFLFLFVFFWTGYIGITKLYKGSPEKTLDYHLTISSRFPFTGREIFLPFSGKWTVWQSFDGEWTHKGLWRHAVDFVVTDDKGKTFSNNGKFLQDYYAFGKPVLSPVDGYIYDYVDNIEDNPPSEVNRQNNWGNYVLIYDNRGFYVLIAHLKKNSIRVKKGDVVQKGSIIGLCGNSGYSPQPHIHIQVQLYPKIGSPTVDFKFYSYIRNNEFFDVGIPASNDIIEPIITDKSLFSKLNLQLDYEESYAIKNKNNIKHFKIRVRMANDGTFYITDGKAKLYFGLSHSTFYFYHMEGDYSSPLKYFFYSASKILLSNHINATWKDYLPLHSLPSRIQKEFLLFLSSFKHNLFSILSETAFVSDKKLKRTINFLGKKIESFVEISDDYGFEKIIYENIEITKVKGGKQV
ncbi:urea transporter [Hippea jasoniae]|uniref:urea transporter n=1 Tax=Hippea jasoniae TaxID=944479 RepID=UPI00068C5C2C|nr:urea transporter [Hippea jasoniae]